MEWRLAAGGGLDRSRAAEYAGRARLVGDAAAGRQSACLTHGRALWPFWQSRGYVAEGCEHLEASLARPGGDPLMRAQALNLLAALSWIRNDLPRASSALDEALPVLEQAAFFVGQGRNFMTRALVAWSQGEIGRMEKMALIGSDRYIRGGDVLGPAICSLILGYRSACGAAKQAIASFTESYRGCLETPGAPFPWGMAIAKYFLGEMAREEATASPR